MGLSGNHLQNIDLPGGPELRRSYGRLLQQNLLSLAGVPHTIVEIVDRILDGGDFHLAAFIMAATARHQANNSLPDSRVPLVQSGSATVYEAALTHKLPVTLAFDSPYEPVQVIQSIARLRYKRRSAALRQRTDLGQNQRQPRGMDHRGVRRHRSLGCYSAPEECAGLRDSLRSQ